jgi:hypothetical protein
VRITKPDWVGLRGLYLLLASDPSAVTVREVQRILQYYEDKYTTPVVRDAMARLVHDNALRGTFDTPASAMSRRLSLAITEHPEKDWDEAREVNLEGRVK